MIVMGERVDDSVVEAAKVRLRKGPCTASDIETLVKQNVSDNDPTFHMRVADRILTTLKREKLIAYRRDEGCWRWKGPK